MFRESCRWETSATNQRQVQPFKGSEGLRPSIGIKQRVQRLEYMEYGQIGQLGAIPARLSQGGG